MVILYPYNGDIIQRLRLRLSDFAHERGAQALRLGALLLPLEELHRPLVLLGGRPAPERAQIPPLSRLRVLLARVEPVLTGSKLRIIAILAGDRMCASARRMP